MKNYLIGLITGITFIMSFLVLAGVSKTNSERGRYEYVSGNTLDLKVFDTETGKLYARGRDFVTEYDIINANYRVKTYALYPEN